MKTLLRTITLALLLVATCGMASAQRINRISGKVYDTAGQPIPGATVREVDSNGRTVNSAQTDGGGLFNMEIRSAKKNHLEVAAQGYQTATQNIDRAIVRVCMEVEGATVEITVGVAVDLGLNVKWADRNVGAASAADYGCFYSWGEVNEKESYTWTDRTNFGDDIIESEYDAAHVYWKKRWTMPSKTDIQELVERCTWTWTERDGVRGYDVKGPNGNSIFLPAGGMRRGYDIVGEGEQGNYWSGSFFENKPESAYALEFNHAVGRLYHGHSLRRMGMMIRPVWR